MFAKLRDRCVNHSDNLNETLSRSSYDMCNSYSTSKSSHKHPMIMTRIIYYRFSWGSKSIKCKITFLKFYTEIAVADDNF